MSDREDTNNFLEFNPPPTGSQRSWLSRTFGRLHKDSLRGSILVMLLTALGTGIFTLHHLFDTVGMIFAYLAILAFGCCFWLVSDILIFSFKYSPYCRSLNDLIRTILGNACSVIFNLVFFMNLFLALVVQLLSISEAFYNNFKENIWKWFNVEEANKNFEYFNFYFCFCAGFVLFFINVKKSIDEFRYFSLFSFLIFLYIITICIWQSPSYFRYLNDKKENIYDYYTLDLKGFLSTYGLLLFSYNCIINFFGVATNVGNPSIRRLRKIFKRTFLILGLLFVVYGTASYLSLGKVHSHQVELFIFRFPISDSDYLMFVGRSLFILSLCVSSGLNVFPLKIMTYDLIGIEKNGRNNFILSLIFTLGTVLIAANFIGITNFVAISGAFTVTLIVFTFPGICALKIGYSERPTVKALITIWIVLLTVMGFVGSYLAFQNLKK